MSNIIITGAGKGIGFELAKLFCAEPGHQVIAISRNIGALIELDKNKNENALFFSGLHPYKFDLVNGSMSELKEFVCLYFDKVDVLINNAGSLVNKPFRETTSADFDQVFQTNLKSVFFVVQKLLPLMVKGSHIVNIGSMGGFQGSSKFPGLSVYSASKGALATLTECLAEELKEDGISVNCLALGAARTEMLETAFPGYNAPLSAKEMAVFIKDFALTGSRYFTGKILPVSTSTP